MPDILDAIDAIVATQSAITVSRPGLGAFSVKRAYPYSPPQNVLPDPPCFTNSWDLGSPGNYPGANRYLDYTVNMQFYAGLATKGDDSRTAAIATAFWPAILQAFQQRSEAGIGGIQLYGYVDDVLTPTCTSVRFRGASPTLSILSRGGADYIGLDLFLDITVSGESFIPS